MNTKKSPIVMVIVIAIIVWGITKTNVSSDTTQVTSQTELTREEFDCNEMIERKGISLEDSGTIDRRSSICDPLSQHAFWTDVGGNQSFTIYQGRIPTTKGNLIKVVYYVDEDMSCIVNRLKPDDDSVKFLKSESLNRAVLVYFLTKSTARDVNRFVEIVCASFTATPVPTQTTSDDQPQKEHIIPNPSYYSAKCRYVRWVGTLPSPVNGYGYTECYTQYYKSP